MIDVDERTNIKRFAEIPVYRKLKALRKELGFTIQEMADKIGMRLESYVFFEREYDIGNFHDKVTLEEFKKICSYFDGSENFEKHKNPCLLECDCNRSELAFEIISQRKILGDSQKELADILRIEEISVISWESGERIPNERCLKNLHAYLGISDKFIK